METRCKRCNRPLTGERSIRKGYGATCDRVVHTQPVLHEEFDPVVEPPVKPRVSLLARILAWLFPRDKEGHIRVGREWMSTAEYRRRFLRGAAK